jgi:hypothetical protein
VCAGKCLIERGADGQEARPGPTSWNRLMRELHRLILVEGRHPDLHGAAPVAPEGDAPAVGEPGRNLVGVGLFVRREWTRRAGRRGVQSGAAAVQMFRTPRWFSTQATVPPVGAVTSSTG